LFILSVCKTTGNEKIAVDIMEKAVIEIR